ncbi:MAG: hypothetical protein R2942_00845 [Ignavibacteria bacterium]
MVEGTSANIILPPGSINYNYRSFETGSVNWLDNTLKEFILRTGNVPTGHYATCVQAFSSDNNLPLSINTCIYPNIIRDPVVNINLISPADGDSVSATNLSFIWASSAPMIPGDYYRFTIAEMRNPSQSCEAALQGNNPVYVQSNIRTSSFMYPTSAPALMPGKKYAWNVSLIRDTGVISESQCSSFGIKMLISGKTAIKQSYLYINDTEDKIREISSCRMKFHTDCKTAEYPGTPRLCIYDITTLTSFNINDLCGNETPILEFDKLVANFNNTTALAPNKLTSGRTYLFRL